MTTNATQAQNATVSFAGQPDAANGLALVRMTIGAMFVWVFFENLGKGGYTPAGYAGVINFYIKSSHSPAAWKWVMGQMEAMRPWRLPCRRRRRSRSESCWSLVYLHVQPPLSHSSSSPAFGSRNGVRHGFGNSWFR